MFSQVSEDKISGLLESKCTVARSVKKFRYFLGDDSRFEDVPKEKLNEKLRLFFAFICKNSGEHLKNVSTRYGISKYLKENCGIDITSDIEFSSCKDVNRPQTSYCTRRFGKNLLSWQYCNERTRFELTPLIHCSTNRLALRPAP
jgi:hypothetical protein